MKVVAFYTKKRCSLCDEALFLLKLLKQDYEFEIEERDIYTSDSWLEEYQVIIPVIDIDGTELMGADLNFVTLSEVFQNKFMT